VVDLDKTVASITRAVEEAERMAGVQAKGVHAGIAGDHIRSLNSRGVVAVSRKDNEIHAADVARVIEAAKAIAIPTDREIIHVIPQEFIVDDQDAIQRAGLKVYDLTLEPLASAAAVLDEDEKDLGVVLLDLGGGTTDVAVFHEGAVRHTSIIPFGGANVTSDIAIGLRTPIDKAEAIKIQFGAALASMVHGDETVSVSGVGGRGDKEISRQLLASMIEPRMEEIFALANKEVRKNHFAPLIGGGVVLTGGTSLLPGAVELAEQVFEMPVRMGLPRGLGGLSANVCDPRYATGVGLVLHAARSHEGTFDFVEVGPSKTRARFDLRNWFADLF
jgi:cell division protein FtsA